MAKKYYLRFDAEGNQIALYREGQLPRSMDSLAGTLATNPNNLSDVRKQDFGLWVVSTTDEEPGVLPDAVDVIWNDVTKTGTFSLTPVPTPEPSRYISYNEFADRVAACDGTGAKLAGIYTLAQTDVNAQIMLDRAKDASTKGGIWLDDPRLSLGLDYLISSSTISAGDKISILS